MSTTFPHASGRAKGYSIEEIEAFLTRARAAYSAPAGEAGLTAQEIRRAAFSLEKAGYSISHVDAALERLEDAFALRERDLHVSESGESAWFGQTRATAQEILNRLARPDKHRFDRVSPLTPGYSKRDVDRFARRVSRYFQSGTRLTVEDVRTVAFRRERGGYREAQVDYLLETVVEVMLAVRA